jgi:hypothetical protein
MANGRYSLYDTTGAHIRDLRRFPLGELAPWPARFDDGKLIEAWIASGRYRLATMDPDAPFAAPRDTLPFPLAGVPLDQWNPSYYVQSGSTVWLKEVPFTEGFEFSLDGRGGVWVGDTRPVVSCPYASKCQGFQALPIWQGLLPEIIPFLGERVVRSMRPWFPNL